MAYLLRLLILAGAVLGLETSIELRVFELPASAWVGDGVVSELLCLVKFLNPEP